MGNTQPNTKEYLLFLFMPNAVEYCWICKKLPHNARNYRELLLVQETSVRNTKHTQNTLYTPTNKIVRHEYACKL